MVNLLISLSLSKGIQIQLKPQQVTTPFEHFLVWQTLSKDVNILSATFQHIIPVKMASICSEWHVPTTLIPYTGWFTDSLVQQVDSNDSLHRLRKRQVTRDNELLAWFLRSLWKDITKGWRIVKCYSLEMDILLWSLLPFMVTYLPPGFFGR